MLWLVKCRAVDSIALFQCHAPTIRETIQISRLQEEKKMYLWSVRKRKTKHSKCGAFLTLSCDKQRSHSRAFQKRDKTLKSVYVCKECKLRTAKPCAPRTRKPQLYGDLEGSPWESIQPFFTGRRRRILLWNVSSPKPLLLLLFIFFFCSHLFALSPRS